MTSWRRNTNQQTLYTSGNYWNDAISPGDTYLRVHINWGFHVDTPITTFVENAATNLITFGLCTTIGNGSEAPPNPQSDGGDASPPTQRWIYWETLAPVIETVSHDAGLIYWRNSQHSELTQTKGQVLAQGIPAGDSLNLWASWACAYDWIADFAANAVIWHSVSVLRKNSIP